MPSSVTLEDILAIDGNRAVYERLQALLADGSAMAFVGAGASFPLWPLWSQLIEALADEPVKRGLANAADKAQWLRAAAQKPLHVAARIHDRLKDNFYHTFLYETFKDRVGADGLGYTPAQAALVRANFKALVTTNYDAGLVEARRVLRPDIRDTGFAVWNQNFQIDRWASGDLFRDGSPCPILFAHGHFADPPGVVLDSGSYHRSYQNTPYRRLFENLWTQEHLVFAGFSFNDAVLAQIADEVLWSTARQGGGAPRHVAILGLDEAHEYTPEMRHEYLEPFNAEALFYPICRGDDGRPDHSALQVLMESLSASPEGEWEVRRETVAPSSERKVLMEFVHESTEDKLFTGRDAELERLDGWATDAGVRLVGVSAIGGLGKTALLGHWLRSNRAAAARQADGIFFWSYYRDNDTDNMLRALLKFGRERLQWHSSKDRDKATLVEQATELLGERCIIVALDGLEVVQESPGTVAYGKLLSPELADLLHRHGRETATSLASSIPGFADSSESHDKSADSGSRSSLIVLTSRFPFPDLTAYLGGSLRTLPLPELEPSKGAELLQTLGVGGRTVEREEISRRLFGHPLALRIFANSMPDELAGDPTRLWELVFDAPHLDGDDSLAGKMQRLLTFYEQRLTEPQRLALGLLAIFRMPVGEATLSVLWTQFKPDTADGTLRGILDGLHHEHLLTADIAIDGTQRYACHPILRDHFRSRLLGQTDLIGDAAKLLGDSPDFGLPSLESIQLIVAAIELLLEAGDIKAADDLYRSRLNIGRVFLNLPAPHWGMEVARWFVRDEARRTSIREQLSNSHLGFYLNEVALFANYAGEPETALEFYPQHNQQKREDQEWMNLSIGLQNFGQTEVSLGLLTAAREHLSEALQLARKIEDDREIRQRLSWNGFIASLLGNVVQADTAFSEANAIENLVHQEGLDLYSLNGIQCAEHLLRMGDSVKARQLTEANRNICQMNNWYEDIGRCEWIFGWLDVLESRWDEAAEHLRAARDIFIRGHMIYDLSRLHVTESAMWLGRGDYRAAYDACERAREMAAPRNYRLVHADALVQRARIWLSLPAPQPGRARDDAEAALQIARFCNYAWAQRDACELLATACRQLGQPDEAARYQTEADQWSRRLTRSGA